MEIKTGWLKYLWKKRRRKVLPQFVRMARFYRIPFETLLENINEVTDWYKAKYTFPIVASVALKNPDLTRMILKSSHEIAVHGFKHVSYKFLSEKEQERDVKMAISTFKRMNIPTYGFRAPYNMYTDYTPRILEKYDFMWDGGIGFNPKYNERVSFFRIPVNGHESKFLCIPLFKWSDDRMIDTYGLKKNQIVKILKNAIKRTKEKQGVIMFDLHPIRIGQPQYVDVLKRILAYGTELNGWFPTVTEAIKHWLKNEQWEYGFTFCCLLTGDIDNFTFLGYLSRLF